MIRISLLTVTLLFPPPSLHLLQPACPTLSPVCPQPGIADIEANTAKELTKLGGVIQVPFRGV